MIIIVKKSAFQSTSGFHHYTISKADEVDTWPYRENAFTLVTPNRSMYVAPRSASP